MGFAPWDVCVPREPQAAAAAAEGAGENKRDKIAAGELWLVTEGSVPPLENESEIEKDP